jgi:hypothetical protein
LVSPIPIPSDTSQYRPIPDTGIVRSLFLNCSQLYSEPSILCPIGKSDHNCVVLRPGVYIHNSAIKKYIVDGLFTEDAVSRIACELDLVQYVPHG